jgi:hypothetical protein
MEHKMKNKLKIGDFIKLPNEVKESARTEYEYAEIEKIDENGKIINLYFVDEKDVKKNRLHSPIEKEGRTFCLHHYDIFF